MASFSPRKPRRLRRPRHLKLPLRIAQILRWADAYHAHIGRWPSPDSGHVSGTNETWMAVASALKHGRRGLPGSTSLSKLLAEHRGYRNIGNLPRLTVSQILRWADAFHA